MGAARGGEDVKSWIRVLLCGFACGVVWALLGGFVVGLAGGEFMSAAAHGEAAKLGAGARALLFALTVAGGVWAMWMYAIVRDAVGHGFKSAALVGIAWWVMAGLQSAKWMTLGGVPGMTAVALGLAALPAMIAATALGAWIYERPPASTSR